jgi:hypothetical protein
MSEGRGTPPIALDVSSALGAVPQDANAGKRTGNWNTAENRFFASGETSANPSQALLLPPPHTDLIPIRRARPGRWIAAGAILAAGGAAAVLLRARHDVTPTAVTVAAEAPAEPPPPAPAATPPEAPATAEALAAAPVAQPEVPVRERREIPPGPPEIAQAATAAEPSATEAGPAVKTTTHAKAKRAAKTRAKHAAKKRIASKGSRAKKKSKRRT